MYTTYYPNLQPYIDEERVNGKRIRHTYIYDVSGQVINKLHYRDGQFCMNIYSQSGFRHNVNGPAYIEWYRNGQIYHIEYWQNGVIHSCLYDGIAYMNWYSTGQIYRISYLQNGKYHNLDGPAIIECHNSQICQIEYWQNGNKIKCYIN